MCPRCGKKEPSSENGFRLEDLDIRVKCTSCKARSAASVWRCECGTLWHHCAVHCTDSGYAMRYTQNTPSTHMPPSMHGNSRVKRSKTVPSHGFHETYEEIHAAEIRRAEQVESSQAPRSPSSIVDLGIPRPAQIHRHCLRDNLIQRLYPSLR